MELKRIYDQPDLERYKTEREIAEKGWVEKFEAQGVPAKLAGAFAKQTADEMTTAPKLAGVEVVHTGVKPEQNFSTTIVTEFARLGIMEIDGKTLTLKAKGEPLHYMIVREPGRWCLHCGQKIADDENGELARLHVTMKHKDAAPIEGNPAGYVYLKHFECVLDKKQHAKYAHGGSNG